jgi:hypothetical protein
MGYLNWVDVKIRKYDWTDIGFTKLNVAGFVLMVAKVGKPLLSLDWSWYVITCVLAAISALPRTGQAVLLP